VTAASVVLVVPSIVAASTDDPLGNPVRLRALARAWGSRWHSLGAVGHLDPASGYGDWPGAAALIRALESGVERPEPDDAPPPWLQRVPA